METKNNLIGTWIELYPVDSLWTFIFTENDTIIMKGNGWNEILASFYQVIAEDSIKVIRNWVTDEAKKTSTHKLIFHTYDTLEIIKFLPSDAAFPWDDVTLYKFN